MDDAVVSESGAMNIFFFIDKVRVSLLPFASPYLLVVGHSFDILASEITPVRGCCVSTSDEYVLAFMFCLFPGIQVKNPGRLDDISHTPSSILSRNRHLIYLWTTTD